MIIFFENGQLGNQLFQYCALRKFKEGSLFVIGMQSLKSMFIGIDISGVTRTSSLVEKIIVRVGKDRIKKLSKTMRLIGSIEECRATVGSEFKVTDGFLKNIYYCDSSFFQSENMIKSSVADKLYLKPELLSQASKIFMHFPKERTATFFIHVRRGDYEVWPNRSSPAILPFNWYIEQMNLIRSKYKYPYFVVVSDDVHYADEMFGDCPDVFVSHNNPSVDFALMSICDGGGILSASTFSWWGAYFARRLNYDALFIAPLYWVGHKSGDWHPKGIKTSWLHYVAVH